MNKELNVIYPEINLSVDGKIKRKRVGAYARVSTKKESQEPSIELQVSTYYKMITSNSEWEFAGIFVDHGKTSTSILHREQFKLLLDFARYNEIDLILVKSMSRFARNTLDALTIIQELREKNVEIFFEKENINSLDTRFDLILTTTSTVAEEESKSISNNCLWTIKKSFQNGKNNVFSLYGYRFTPSEEYIIYEDEAKWVRFIFEKYADGWTSVEIIKSLSDNNVKSRTGKSTWNANYLRMMLKNEKYVGDLILQKTFRKRIGAKSCTTNRNDKTKYYIKDNHKGIISRDLYDKVQNILEERRKKFKAPLKISNSVKSPETPVKIFSIQLNKHLQIRYNHRNTKYEVKYFSTARPNYNNFKPIYYNHLNQMLVDATNYIKSNLSFFKKQCIDYCEERIKNSRINESIDEYSKKLDDLLEKIKVANNLDIDESGKNEIISRLQDRMISFENKINELRYKRIMHYYYERKLSLYFKKMNELSNDTLENASKWFTKIIAIDRENLLFCIQFSNIEYTNDMLLSLTFSKPLKEDTNFFIQTRAKINTNWKIVII